MEKKKYLIINADDFGICSETNRAIEELFRDKKITSTSILVSGKDVNEAIQIAKINAIKVGIHFTFNSDFSDNLWHCVSPYESVKSLVNKDGFFHYDLGLFNKGAKSEELDRELLSQYNFIKDCGVEIDHADSHSGTLYGINGRLFFLNAFRFCKKTGLPFRFPKSNNFLKGFFNGRVPSYIKLAHKLIIGTSKMYGVRLIDDLFSNPYSIEKIDSYTALENYYLEKIRGLEYGVTEMFLHPSYDAPQLNIKEWKKRVYELEFLNSKKLARVINDEGIELCSYEILRNKR